MAVQQTPAESIQRHAGPEHTPRLRLKRKAPVSGYVDGAWWPHSDDLTTELPDLLAVLSVRLGTIARVMYNLDEWAPAPRRITLDAGPVRLDGYHGQPPHTLEIQDKYGNNIVLLVVPAHTDPDRAHWIASAAATADDATSVEALLAAVSEPVAAERP